jgi:hypothetical protein
MKTPKEILEDNKAPAAVLLLVATSEYGPDCYEWDPLVLKAQLQEDFDCVMSDLQSDKLQAAIVVLVSDNYERNIQTFETVNYLFNHYHDSMDEFNPLEPEELILGLTEAYLIRGEEIKFSPEVRVYAGLIFKDYGMHRPPELFPQAIMEEKDGDDTAKNEALQQIFDTKIKVIEKYIENASIK